MRTRNLLLICPGVAALIAVTPGPDTGQTLTGASASPEYKYSTSMPPGVASPDKVETRFGTLNFFDGFPDKSTSECGLTSTTAHWSRRFRPKS